MFRHRRRLNPECLRPVGSLSGPMGSFVVHADHGFLRGELFLLLEAPADSKRRKSCCSFRPFKSGGSNNLP